MERAPPPGAGAHGYLADTTEAAAAQYYPSYAHAMSVIGRERGWGAMTPHQFDALRSARGSLVLGNPEQVAEKILRMRQDLGIERFLLHVSVGTLPHAQVLRSIELLGTEVAPPWWLGSWPASVAERRGGAQPGR